MKRFLLVLGTVLFLALLLVPSAPANAMGLCVANPPVGNLGTVFVITCNGFFPNSMATAWLTEPDGHVVSWPGGRVSSGGTFTTIVPTNLGLFSLALGDWAMTVQDNGLTGIARFHLNGATEGVSGASLVVNGNVARGTGFLPFEIVSLWVNMPNGDCSGLLFTIGLSTAAAGSVKADASGSFAVGLVLPAVACNGTYELVARGNASGLGATATFTTANNPTPGTIINTGQIVHVGDVFILTASGFAPFESVSCWLTSPQGQVLPLPSMKATSGGSISQVVFTEFELRTRFVGIAGSLGAEGLWTVTCRGNATGATLHVTFVLAGNTVVDP